MSNKYTFKFTPLALEDIENIFNYITGTLCNQKAANELMDELENVINNACLFPKSHPFFENSNKHMLNIRKVPIKNFTLFYEEREDIQQINILRIRYAKSDINDINFI